VRIIEDIQPEIDADKVQRLLGHRIHRRLPRRTAGNIRESIPRVCAIIKPKVLYAVREVERTGHDCLILRGCSPFRSRSLTLAIKRCENAVIFLATIGRQLDSEITGLMDRGRLMQAYIIDAVGSVAVERTAEEFQGRMDRDLSAANRHTSMRFSPGYCDWELPEQRKIFRILDGALIDVEINTGCLMSPRKSVSGVFGIGDARHISRAATNPCTRCRVRCCLARRIA